MKCAQCGQENPPGFRFCGGCGSPLVDAPRREERKSVTVLFADLVGFTSRSEHMDVEDVRGTLAPYHALLRDQLEHYGGTVEKFIGDAVMALFGAPTAHEDDPERAVRAALAIRAAIARLNDEEPGLDLHVRVGVNTGEALVVLDADPARGEGMASGDVVNTAARLQTAAPVDGILVGEATYWATDRAITYREADPVEAKGKSQALPVWEAVEARARFGVDVIQRPTTPLVGRVEEVDLLVDALRRARAERAAHLVTLIGVPGIGKSRLVWELLQAVESDPDFITWRQGRSLPYGDGVAYWALGEMVKAQAGILDSDTADEALGKLTATVADLISDPAEGGWVEEHVRALVGLGADDAGGDRQAEATSAWRRFFEALADQAPLVLVFEDLHWADDALLDFVDHLIEWSSSVPMLVVCTARPELLDRRREWGGGKRNAQTIAVTPLADQDVARLLGGLLEQVVLPAETQSVLLGTAAGNPLYAEEYVRMLIDRGHLRREGDRWRIVGDAALPVPESVQGLIAARLDNLSVPEKQLIQDASVLGKVVWAGALAAMSGDSTFVVEERLHALERREMLRRERRSSVGRDTEYAFRHVLMRDVAYGQIPRAERAQKHRRAAEWIESLSADREDAPDMIAYHYQRALEYARDAGEPTDDLALHARLALRDAAERALALNSFTTASNHYLAALGLWPDDDDDWPALIVAVAGNTPSWLGPETTPLLQRATNRLAAAGDLAAAAQGEFLIGSLYWNEGRREQTVQAVARSLGYLDHAAPSPAVAWVLQRLAVTMMVRGEQERSLGLCERALAMAEQFDLEEVRCNVLNTRGVSRVESGDMAGIADLDESIELAVQLNSAVGMIRAYKNLGSTLHYVGDLGRVDDLYRRGLETAVRFGDEYQIVWFETELGGRAYEAGDWDLALELFERLDSWVGKMGPHYMEAAATLVRALILAGRGDRAGARVNVDSALEFSRRSGDPQVLLPTLGFGALVAATAADDPVRAVADLYDELAAASADRLAADETLSVALALALTGQGDRYRLGADGGVCRWPPIARLIASERYGEAVTALEPLGIQPELALTRLLHARALLAAGDAAGSEAELRRALDFWRDVGAGAYIAMAEELQTRTG